MPARYEEPDNDEQDYHAANEAVKPSAEPVEIPPSALSAAALDAMIEAFILREGTDYGASEVALDTKKRQVQRQLESEDVRIIYDPDTESVTLMNDRDWQRPKKLQS